MRFGFHSHGDNWAYLVHDKYTFKGVNFNIGFLWKYINQSKFSFALTFKPPFKADLDNEHVTLYAIPSKINYKLNMPSSIGVGLSYQFSDEFLMALDLYRIQWKQFILKEPNGNVINPITGLIEKESSLKPTNQGAHFKKGGIFEIFLILV